MLLKEALRKESKKYDSLAYQVRIFLGRRWTTNNFIMPCRAVISINIYYQNVRQIRTGELVT